ncbi:group II intron reverse transcriptase/maturase [Intrasporangium chromatireducens]|uniref:group II intron reverse transcriptase/maturase n=1 Tax=Intrasporangium chromatireducens TaxID=1386088 RepID=UPI0004B9E60C|nr:group II intron reverse transcriptase/maturase [Intrasporangium chromatireducens]
MELSPEKTLITHARTGAARFLGYDIRVGHNQRFHRNGRRSVNGAIQLSVPDEVIRSAAAPYLAKGKPGRRAAWMSLDDYTIVATYGAKYRGIAQYYLLAGDIRKVHRLRWVMETSMLKTLAGKHGSSVSKMAARYKAKVMTPKGPRTCFEATLDRDGRKPLVARFGGFPLARAKAAVITDRPPEGPAHPRKELIDRLRRGVCEMCGSRDSVKAHHVKALADLDRSETAPVWAQIMAARRRKTLIVCSRCFDLTHR